MLHIGSDWADGIDCPGIYLWRLMIGAEYQGRGYGKAAVLFLVEHLKSLGIKEIFTSYHLGDGSPERFYLHIPMKPTSDSGKNRPPN